MEEALVLVGLPVKCRTCLKSGHVKPQTDYDGWARWKPLRGVSIWYCPEHAEYATKITDQISSSVAQPVEEVIDKDVEAELYSLLD